MRDFHQKKYFFLSFIAHLFILIMLMIGFDFSTPLPVFENTNKHDVISAVVLWDSINSKVLPDKPQSSPMKKVEKEKSVLPPLTQANQNQQEAIALKLAEKKKLATQKILEEKKRRDQLTKDFLADMEKINKKQKKIKQTALKTQFEKTLRAQAEKSLRQQLLNEEIKLKGTESREAQGIINKYQALILQTISEHWIIPTQSNKKLYCELLIRVAPGGMVLDVQISKTSGDPALDSSARAAVLKSSPLPVPKEADIFESFRQFVLKVKPENIISQIQ